MLSQKITATILGGYLRCLLLILGLLLTVRQVYAGAGQLTIYSATDLAAIQPLITAFQKKFPAINVNYVEFQSRQLFKIVSGEEADTTPGRPQPDLIISSAMDLQTKLVNDGYAQPYYSELTEQLPAWANWRNEAFGFTFEPAVFVYSKRAFVNHSIPDSHERLTELLRSESAFFEQRIGTYDVNLSGVGYLFATQDMIHSSINGRLLESLGRAQARTYCCTNDILEDLAGGELVLGHNLLGSYALARVQQYPDLGIVLPKDYTLAMSRVAFIHKDAHEPVLAGHFLDYLLSVEGQNLMASSSGLIPLRIDAEGPFSRAELGRLFITNFQPIALNPTLLVYLDQLKRERFLREWRDSIFYDDKQ